MRARTEGVTQRAIGGAPAKNRSFVTLVGGADRAPPRVQHVRGDSPDARPVRHLREDHGPVAAHPRGVAGHHLEIAPTCGGEIGLVDRRADRSG